MIFETGLSTLNVSRAKRAPNTINFVDMRRVLVFFSNISSISVQFVQCTKPYWFVRIVQHSPTADVDGCREDESADLDFGVYHGHDSHGSRSIIMITGFLMASSFFNL